MLPGASGHTCGAPGLTASRRSTAGVRSSYSTVTSSAPSCAAVSVSPITMATASPMWRTVLPASAGRNGRISFVPPRPATGGCWEILPSLASSMSAAVSTASTPGTAFAAVVSIDLISAKAWGERTK